MEKSEIRYLVKTAIRESEEYVRVFIDSLFKSGSLDVNNLPLNVAIQEARLALINEIVNGLNIDLDYEVFELEKKKEV